MPSVNTLMFALESTELSTTDLVTYSIDTGEQQPSRQPPRCTSFALRNKINDIVDEMLECGVIQHSKSPWASPVVIVEKKDGSLRFGVDYQQLNVVTKVEVFPLPKIDDSLALLSKSKYFSTLNLATGFWQVPMEPDSQEKTAFITHADLYKFTVIYRLAW